DTLTGDGSANALTGGAGNDALNGGAGGDAMAGGLGNDRYVVGNAGDVVTESAGEGTETLSTARASYKRSDDVEIVVFSGVGGFVGTGNALNNTITGGTGNDTLEGGLGNDVLAGGLGIDALSYAGATAGVTVNLGLAGARDTIGAGIDTVSG